MSDSNFLVELRLLAEQQRYDDLLKRLEQIQVQKLTKEEQDAADAIFSMLPQETLDSSVELCYSRVLLKIQTGDLTAAKKWYNHLIGMRDTIKEEASGRQLLENRIFCAALCLPLGPNANLLLNLAVLANEFGDAKFPLARVSVTGKFPSVLRGAKDLSGLAKHYRATASIVRPLLGAFLEGNGTGVCEAGIAEVLYERNDLNGASLQVACAINAENPEIAFAALSLLARLGAVDTTAKPPAEILAHIGDMLQKKNAHWLIPNYKALCARFDILRGDTEKVREWMEGCGLNDLDGFTLRDSYALLTKAKAYIALGEYRNAATLLESLTQAMQKEQRTLDTVECLVNGAVVCDLLGSGELAIAKLEQALLLAQEYGYIRVFADCGKQLFHLIVRYVKEARSPEELSEKYIKKVTESAKIYSTICPALYAYKNGSDGETGEGDELTQNELHVLQLVDEGKLGYNPRKGLSFLFANIKTSVFDTAPSRHQRELKEYQMMRNLKTGTQNVAYTAKRRGGSAVILYKMENQPWTQRSILPYLRRVNMEALQKTMPFLDRTGELSDREKALQEQKNLQKELAGRMTRQKYSEMAAIRARRMELMTRQNELGALLYRKDTQQRLFFRKLNSVLDMQKHQMFAYYRDRRRGGASAKKDTAPVENNNKPEDQNE